MGLFLVFCSWGILTGWGTDNIDSFVKAKENPTFILARRFWGNGWVLLLFALVNSMVAVAISCNNVATRMWYAMGRSGSMPAFFAVVHPKFQTPKNAVIFQTLLTIAFGLCLSWMIGVENDFDFMGLVITFTLAIVYAMGNIGVIKYYRTEKKGEFNIILHVLFPIIGILVLGVIIWTALIPWPEAPIGYAFWVVVVWLIVGLIVLGIMKVMKKEGWRANAGDVAAGEK
jgi:amino acid transporter